VRVGWNSVWAAGSNIKSVIINVHITLDLYRIILLLPHRARQLYRTVRLHPPMYPVTAAVLRTAIKETNCICCV